MTEEITVKKLSAVEERQKKDKEVVLEQLKQTPIIQICCQKVGMARATFYRWKQDDKEFAEAVDVALAEGNLLINDVAESQLLSLIKAGNLTAINLWLRTHHRTYSNKLEVIANINNSNQSLTPEQQAIVEKALTLALANNAENSGEESK